MNKGGTIRLDHIAYRVKDRDATSKFFIEAFGYKYQQEFDIFFDDEKKEKARCIALEPPEKVSKDLLFTVPVPLFSLATTPMHAGELAEYHLAPEIFVSDGTPGSIVHNWVKARGGIGGIHHLAYQVDSVSDTVKAWKDNGWAEFTSETPFKCEDLTQVFSTPHKLTGVIFEFIERKGFGFCKENVKSLMRSTAELDRVNKDK